MLRRFSSTRKVRRSRLLFLAEFFETWIIPQRIKHGIEPKQGRSERHVCRKGACVRYREQFPQSVYSTVGFAHFRRHARKDIERNGAQNEAQEMAASSEKYRTFLSTTSIAGRSEAASKHIMAEHESISRGKSLPASTMFYKSARKINPEEERLRMQAGCEALQNFRISST